MRQELERSLVYGNYPDVVFRSREEAVGLLISLSSSYLYKDILELERIRKPAVIEKIVTLLAFQVGNEVNLSEIGRAVSLNVRTVESYIDLLEKAFIVFRLRAYSNNERNEVTRNFKVYFYDIGIRNAIINNFSPLDKRIDVGALFENWCILERRKAISEGGEIIKSFFWRTYTKKEIDYIEQKDGKLFGYEFKYTKEALDKDIRVSAADFLTKLTMVNKNTVTTFLGGE
jgi:predicted AAA+ superfamily ATPase